MLSECYVKSLSLTDSFSAEQRVNVEHYTVYNKQFKKKKKTKT